MRILLVAHACRPVGGSEPGGAWNWALHLARYHDISLICHPQYQAETDPVLAAAGHPFRIHYVVLPRSIDPWTPERGERGLRLHYMLWQKWALRVARRLHREDPFDLVHQVGLGSVSAPSPFWRLGIPAVWGPLGGGQTAPPMFRRYFGEIWSRETIRRWRVQMLPYWPAMRRTVGRCALVLATNHETLDVLRRAGAPNPLLFADNGVEPDSLDEPLAERGARDHITLLWAGRLEARKGLPLGLEALSRVNVPVKLQVAGDGPLRAEWESLAQSFGVKDRVEFLGRLSSDDLRTRFREADGFLFTSLQDSTGSVVWQAMAQGLPLITLDHQGVGALIPKAAAMKIQVSSPEITVAALAHAIEAFAAMGTARERLGRRARRVAGRNSWPRRAAIMSQWYERIVNGSSPIQTTAEAVCKKPWQRSQSSITAS